MLRTGKKRYCSAVAISDDIEDGKRKVKFHFPKVPDKFDEWIELPSDRVAPLNTKQGQDSSTPNTEVSSAQVDTVVSSAKVEKVKSKPKAKDAKTKPDAVASSSAPNKQKRTVGNEATIQKEKQPLPDRPVSKTGTSSKPIPKLKPKPKQIAKVIKEYGSGNDTAVSVPKKKTAAAKTKEMINLDRLAALAWDMAPIQEKRESREGKTVTSNKPPKVAKTSSGGEKNARRPLPFDKERLSSGRPLKKRARTDVESESTPAAPRPIASTTSSSTLGASPSHDPLRIPRKKAVPKSGGEDAESSLVDTLVRLGTNPGSVDHRVPRKPQRPSDGTKQNARVNVNKDRMDKRVPSLPPFIKPSNSRFNEPTIGPTEGGYSKPPYSSSSPRKEERVFSSDVQSRSTHHGIDNGKNFIDRPREDNRSHGRGYVNDWQVPFLILEIALFLFVMC